MQALSLGWKNIGIVMLEIKFVRQHLPEVEKALSSRGQTLDLDVFKQSDAKHKSILLEIENLRHGRNVVSEQIATMKKDGQDADILMTQMREVSGKIKALDQELSESQDKINQILFRLPNMPHKSVPEGKDSSKNPVVRQIGIPRDFDFEPLPHWTLGTWVYRDTAAFYCEPKQHDKYRPASKVRGRPFQA